MFVFNQETFRCTVLPSSSTQWFLTLFDQCTPWSDSLTLSVPPFLDDTVILLIHFIDTPVWAFINICR